MAIKRVAVVTGANKGIGHSIVKFLCQQFDGDVILCSRELTRGEKAVEKLEELGLKPILHQLAIDDETSVKKLRDFLVQEYSGLDVLVNNAAIAFPQVCDVPFPEQAQETLRINYWATASVCDILFPILRPSARVVNVSSSAGLLMRVPGEELKKRLASESLTRQELDEMVQQYLEDVKAGVHQEKGWSGSAYLTSKVCLTALTWIQQRDFDKDPREDIVVNAVHPGFVDTDMTNHKGVLHVDEGAKAPTIAALIPPKSGPKGSFYWYDGQIVNWFTYIK